MDLFIQDVRYGLRRMVASPLFSVMAILIIALGIAANTAVFSAVNAFILRPPPFADAGRVVHVYQHSDEGQPQSSSFPAYRAIASRTDVFAGAAAFFSTTVNVETDSGVRQSPVEFVSSSYFPVLGLRPSSGRWFAPEEDAAGSATVAVVSDHAWRTRFGSAPDIIGRSLRLGGALATIVGVGPVSYNGSATGLAVDFWLPLSSLGPVQGAFFAATFDRPQDHLFQIRARLRDDVTIEQARAAMDGLAAELGARFAGRDQVRRIEVMPARSVRIHPTLDRGLVPAATLLMGVVGLVLALVCSNLAIMLLLRGTSKHREISIRMAMGAGRGRIVRQLLTESLVLSSAGGLVGCIGAIWLLDVVSATDLPFTSGLVRLPIDVGVLAFATILSIATGIAFGLVPAVRAVKIDAASVLGGVSARRHPVAMRYGMVAFQIALSIVLLTGTGLIIRSTQQMSRVDIGFETARLAMVATNALQAGYPPAETQRVFTEIERRLAAIPGVESVVRTSRPPLGPGPTNTLVIEGYVSPTGTNTVDIPGVVVTPGYFERLGIQVVRGRAFGPQDDQSGPPVAVVNEAMARRFWGTVDVVGRRYRHDGQSDSWVEIVGVAANAKVTSLTEEPLPQVYRSWDQTGWPVASFIVRTAGPPSQVVGTLAATVRGFDSRLPITQLVTMDDYIDRQLLLPRIAAGILSGFSFTALVLAALGLYAVVAFAVGERTKEIGIRIALGAGGPGVVWIVVRAVMITVTIGIAVGLLASLGAGRALSAVLFNVSSSDPATLLAGIVLLALVAVVAAVIPAMRATRVDPATVLRYQ